MDTGYKHFSHAHNLVIHQAHEAAKMSCTGCNSLVMGTIYVCWPCNFMLHEQCFRATRSLIHPSHPSHPLTLVPYPTYPSNSFYCDTCKLTGNGLSYSCSDCEFDLHVLCAHSITNTSRSHQPSMVLPNQTHGQEIVPQSGQSSYQAQNVYPPTSVHNPITNFQYSSVAPIMPVEEFASDREHIKKNERRLEIAREEYRIAALGRQYALDSI
ncbi:unnamed protein product [Lactuca saligna]|uniref:DC1 domain-containing protein n=1 Tax=Lactuca saligna TaxID=75948 RepID=A0AA35YSX5_LACSI|nr:unnamed protein product [Lactuca saligna]